jgi:hypothetical protein
MNPIPATRSNKVPEVVLAFWIIKIIATTLGETGGDAVSMSMGLGYARVVLVRRLRFGKRPRRIRDQQEKIPCSCPVWRG